MRISKINAKNFKGQSFEMSLAPVTIISGPSFKGKSARLEAGVLALCGQLPDVAAKAGDVYDRLASGVRMSVNVVMDNAWFVSRTYSRGSKSATCEVGVNGFADGYKAPLLMFDAGEILGLSPNERTKELFRILPPPSLEDVKPAALTGKFKVWKGDLHTEHHTAAVTELCSFILQDFKDKGEQTAQDWLSCLTEKTRLKANAAKAQATTMKQTIAGVTQLRDDGGASLAVAEKGRSCARTILDEANKKVSQLETEIAACRQDWESNKTILKARVNDGTDYEEVRKTLVYNEARLPDVERTVPAPLPSRAPLDATVLSKQTAWHKVNNALANATAEVLRVKTQIDAAKNETTCPHCSQDVTKLNAKIIKSLRVDLKGAEKNAELGLVALTNAQDSLNCANDAVKDWEKKNAARETALAAVTELKSEISQDQGIMAKGSTATAAQAALVSIAEKGKQLKEELTTAQTDQSAKQTSYDTTDETHKQAVAAAASAQSSRLAAEQADKAQAEAQATTALLEMLTALLQKCVNDSTTAIVQPMNRVCEGILNAPVMFKDGELGLNRGATMASWKACSDGEQMVMQCALRVALATTAPLRLAIINRMESLDWDVRKLLVARLCKLVKEGMIDQCLLVEVAAPGSAADSYRPNDLLKVIDITEA